MAKGNKALKTFNKGHKFYKSIDCLSCLLCELLTTPSDGFLALPGASAKYAITIKGITNLQHFSALSEEGILQFQGIGFATLPILRAALADQ